jgi:glycosyltransferase involved in cell wall biosynthesis
MVPRVSVIIPCFNLGQYLGEAIASVGAQTWTDYDLTVVDDGSTAGETLRALDAFERSGTRVIHSPNRGLSAARNLGIRQTTGDYVCSLDADDRLHPEWIERAVAVLDSDPEVAFVSHWLDTFGDEHWDWKPVRCDLAMLLDINVINGAALVRRGIVEDAGGFDDSMRDGCEDWEFWIRVMERGHKGVILPEVLYHYRRRHESMSRRMKRDGLHPRLYAQIVERHSRSYEAHLLDLLLRREWTIANLCRGIRAVEDELHTFVEPALVERRTEVERGRSRLEAVEGADRAERERQALTARVASLDAEVERQRATIGERDREFRASWSWRLTAPLRCVYERLRPGRRR